MATFQLPTYAGPLRVEVNELEPLFVLGPNGTGKSALVHKMRSATTEGRVVYIPGSRPVYFTGERLSLTPLARQQLKQNTTFWDQQPQARWTMLSGTERNEGTIHDLQAAEIQFKVEAADEIAAEGTASAAVARLQAGHAPLDRVNRLLSQAALPVRLAVSGGELAARRGDSTYSISKMSDGERAAVILIGEVISAVSGATFIIDEPELHLHRSIVVPLLNAVLKERPDCAFVICTHELELPATVEGAQVLLVRSCRWDGEVVTAWDLDLLPPAADIPERLRTDVLGGRRKILFVEGGSGSLDQPIYGALFPEATVRPRESCLDVRRAVVGLRAVQGLHTVEPFGLVDNDGLSSDTIAELEADGVYALPIFAVESLYYSRAVREALARQQAASLGLDAAELAAVADSAALASLNRPETVQHLAARLAERAMRDAALSALPDRTSVIAAGDAPIVISVASPFEPRRLALQSAIDAGDLDAVIASYPVRESGALTAIAHGLRFPARSDYERAAVVRIAHDCELAEALKQRLAGLTAALA